MSSIKIFLLVFVVGVAAALILETLKKRKKLQATVAASTDYMSANEAMPTQTGKYRVQEALKAPQKNKRVQSNPVEPEAEKLPDPFDIEVGPNN